MAFSCRKRRSHLPATSIPGETVVKRPKLFFTDTGFAAWLCKIPSAETLSKVYNSGSFFENFVIMEILKSWIHNGEEPHFYYYRDTRFNENRPSDFQRHALPSDRHQDDRKPAGKHGQSLRLHQRQHSQARLRRTDLHGSQGSVSEFRRRCPLRLGYLIADFRRLVCTLADGNLAQTNRGFLQHACMDSRSFPF